MAIYRGWKKKVRAGGPHIIDYLMTEAAGRLEFERGPGRSLGTTDLPYLLSHSSKVFVIHADLLLYPCVHIMDK